ncbi:hypothetical protein ES703_06085 [subsurface metagenome]|nr:hypothetical protein [Dehalococcoidia bacterium]
MTKQWERNTKRKFYLLVALGLVLILSGGVFAYTYTTAIGTASVGEPSADVATCNVSTGQPDWSSVTDNLSKQITCGASPQVICLI